MYVRLPQAMEPGSNQVSTKTDDRLSPSPRFYCSVAATTLLTNGDFPAGNRLILKVIGWRQKDASGEGFADRWLQITRLVGAWPNCCRYGYTRSTCVATILPQGRNIQSCGK